MASIVDHPDVLLHEIAKRLDYKTICQMKLVNHRFLSALSDSLLWIELCERDGVVLPSREFRRSLAEQAQTSEACAGQIDFERVWVKNPFRANLVPPMLPSFNEMRMTYGWVFREVGWADRMTVEEPPFGVEAHPEIDRCIATSYQWGEKTVSIDLAKAGLSEWILDHIRPRIIVSEFAAPRWDCAAEYEMRATLHRAGENENTREYRIRTRKERREWPQWTTPTRWEKVEIGIEDYPIGMRVIRVESRGKDKQGWAGNYGSKYANLQIRIEMPDEARWLGEADFPDRVEKLERSDTSSSDDSNSEDFFDDEEDED